MRVGTLLLVAGVLGGCATAGNGGGTSGQVDAGEEKPHPPDAAADPFRPDAAPRPDAGTQAGSGDGGPPLGVCEQAQQQPKNDACADAIDLSAEAATTGGATAYGDTSSYADEVSLPAGCAGPYTQDGPDAIYKVDAASGQTISVTMTPEGYDGAVYVLTDCTDVDTCVAGADGGYEGGVESVEYSVGQSGTYFVVVDSYVPDAFGCFTVNVTLQ